MIAHPEVAVRRNNEVAVLNVLRHSQLPLRSHVAIVGRRDRRKIVAVGIIRISACLQHIRLVQLFTVAIDHPVAQVNSVSGNAHDPLHYVKVRLGRGEKYHDVSTMDPTIRKDGAHPTGSWRELHTIHKNVVADEQRVLHGGGRNFKCLNHEGDNEQTGY